VQLASALPASVLSGSKGKASVRVVNNSTFPLAGNPSVRLVLSSDSTVDAGDTEIQVPAAKPLKLKAGASKTLKYRFNYPQVAEQSNLFLLAQVNGNDAVGETDKSNNTAASATPVAVAPAFIDLSPTVVSATPSPASAGGKAAVRVGLRNDGNVPFSGPATIELFASTDATLDDADTSLLPAAAKNQKIKNGATKNVNVKFTAPALAAGTYFVIARVTSTGAIADSVTANNVSPATVTLVVV
jgi:hypothetical protein